MDDENKIQSVASAVKELSESVPVYQDLLQPPLKQIGKSLETITKTVNIGLSPLRSLVWGYEQIEDWISTKLVNKLENIPAEEIITPDLLVAGPALESLKFSGHNEEISDFYATLLATAMQKSKASNAHPAFVKMVQQLSPDEAKLLKWLSALSRDKGGYIINFSLNLFFEKGGVSTSGLGVRPRFSIANDHNIDKFGFSAFSFEKNQVISHAELLDGYIDNLVRLKILDKSYWIEKEIKGITLKMITKKKIRKFIKNKIKENEFFQSKNRVFGERKKEITINCQYRQFKLTTLGQMFLSSCVGKEVV